MTEKRPGPDWDIEYISGDDVRDTMTVFGAMTVDDALVDARQSLSASEMIGIEPDYQIIGIAKREA